MARTRADSPLTQLPTRWRLRGPLVAAGGLLASLFFMYMATPEPWNLAPISLLSVNTWMATLLLAAVGAAVSGSALLAQVVRSGPSREHGPRRHWAAAFTLPFLLLTLAFPFVTPDLWYGPRIHLVAALVASGAALWLVASVVRRLSTWRWSRTDLHPAQLASTRPRAARHIDAIWQAVAEQLDGRLTDGALPVPKLRAAGDGDMHLELELGDMTMRIFDGLVQVTAPSGWVPDTTLERITARTDLRVHPGHGATLSISGEAWQLDVLGRAAAELVLDWQPVLELDGAPLAGDAPDDRVVGREAEFLAVEANGTRVGWAFTDDRQLIVAREDGRALARFDLEAPFSLQVVRSPHDDSEPRLGLVLRQRDGHTTDDAAPDGVALANAATGLAGGRWREARLSVPLRWRDPQLDDLLGEQTVSGPVLMQPQSFVGVWKRLYWTCVEHGGHPVALPTLPLGHDLVELDDTPLERVEQQHWKTPAARLARAWPVLVGGAVVASAAAFVSLFESRFVVFPYWEAPELSPVLWSLAVPALIVGGALAWRASMPRYLRAATSEVLDLLAHSCGLDVWRARITVPALRTSVSSFSARGRRATVYIELEQGLVARLSVWSGGMRSAGLVMVEQLELCARPSRGARRDYRQMLATLHGHITALDAHAHLTDVGPERVLSMQARRIVGSGRGAWSSLKQLVAPGTVGPASTGQVVQTALEVDEPETRSKLLMEVGLLQAPTLPALDPAPLRHILERAPRGWRYAMAVAALSCSALALPRIDSDAYPVSDEGPDPALLAACPVPRIVPGAGREPLQDVLEEYRCALNAAGHTAPIAELTPSHHFKLVPGEAPGRHWHRTCEDTAVFIEEMTQPHAANFGLEMYRRWLRNLATEPWLVQVWSVWPDESLKSLPDLGVDTDLLIERAVDCAPVVTAEQIDRLVELRGAMHRLENPQQPAESRAVQHLSATR